MIGVRKRIIAFLDESGRVPMIIAKTRDFAKICEKIKEKRGFVMNPRFGLSDKT